MCFPFIPTSSLPLGKGGGWDIYFSPFFFLLPKIPSKAPLIFSVVSSLRCSDLSFWVSVCVLSVSTFLVPVVSVLFLVSLFKGSLRIPFPLSINFLFFLR